eukprot:scaffold270880_cov18-Tisochrysis_lutea.AAC.1
MGAGHQDLWVHSSVTCNSKLAGIALRRLILSGDVTNRQGTPGLDLHKSTDETRIHSMKAMRTVSTYALRTHGTDARRTHGAHSMRGPIGLPYPASSIISHARIQHGHAFSSHARIQYACMNTGAFRHKGPKLRLVKEGWASGQSCSVEPLWAYLALP